MAETIDWRDGEYRYKKGYWLYIRHVDGRETFAGWFHYRRGAIKTGKRIVDDSWGDMSYRTVKAAN